MRPKFQPEYKQAMVDYGEKDIVMTTKLSGSALTVINTPYVQQLGTKANWLEWILNNNKTLKKYAKMLIAFRGMKKVEKAAFGATYKTVWCAGPAIEHVTSIQPLGNIIKKLTDEFKHGKAGGIMTSGLSEQTVVLMKAASLNEIKKELSYLDLKRVQELCMRLAKYKKENKELLTYLLFEAGDEPGYVAAVKNEMDDHV